MPAPAPGAAAGAAVGAATGAAAAPVVGAAPGAAAGAAPGAAPGAAADITCRRDVHDLVVGFYREIVFDDLLAPVFDEVAEIDWAVHIPKLIDYWCRTLLGEPGYRGAIVAAHRHVHEIEPFRVEHFDRWYGLWVRSIDAGWRGPVAEEAKRHAARVGGSLAHRLLDTEWRPAAVTEPG